MARAAPAYLLTRNSRHSVRFRIPADLVARTGRREIVRALGSSDPRAARMVVARLGLSVTPMPARRLDPWLLRRILAARRAGHAIHVLHQPMDQPEPMASAGLQP